MAVGVGQREDQVSAVHLLHPVSGDLLRTLDLGPVLPRGDTPRFFLRITHDGKHLAVADAMSIAPVRLFSVADGGYMYDIAPRGCYSWIEECASGWVVVAHDNAVSYCRR